MTKGLLLALALASVASVCLAMSIDNEPVKVTHRNSGPRYDLDDELEMSKLTPVSQTAPQQEPPQQPSSSSSSSSQAASGESNRPAQEENSGSDANGDQMPIGHVSIRRIFLVPMMRPIERPVWRDENEQEQPTPARRHPADSESEHDNQEGPSMFAKPFWPFMTPARPAHSMHHLFGADEASRSPPHRDEDKAESSSSGEREGEQPPTMAMRPAPHAESAAANREPALLDPIQMMLEMMQQAINSQLTPPMPNSPDLNEGATSTRADKSPDQAASPNDERPKVPLASETDKPKQLAPRPPTNETREDVVEIEGKKYLRKTVINRHVGENIIFMTKRLIFVPLNETEPATSTTVSEQPSIPTTTTTTPANSEEVTSTTTTTTTTVAPNSSETPLVESRSEPVKPAEEISTPGADATTTMATEPQPTTTGKESIIERVSEAIEKAAERMVERVSSPAPSTTTPAPTTDKPVAN